MFLYANGSRLDVLCVLLLMFSSHNQSSLPPTCLHWFGGTSLNVIWLIYCSDEIRIGRHLKQNNKTSFCNSFNECWKHIYYWNKNCVLKMMTCRNDLMNLMTREYSGYPNWHWLIMSICNCSYNQLCTVQVVCSTNTHSSSADTSWQLHNGCQTVNFTNIYQDTLSEFTRMIISDLAVYFIVAFWLWADKILYNIGVSRSNLHSYPLTKLSI